MVETTHSLFDAAEALMDYILREAPGWSTERWDIVNSPEYQIMRRVLHPERFDHERVPDVEEGDDAKFIRGTTDPFEMQPVSLAPELAPTKDPIIIGEIE